jgi:DNA-binding transcriptional MerR regulator
VAERVGLSLRTIRHYEEVEVVVPSARSAGGFRLYTEADIERLIQVKAMKPLGFSLDETRELMALRDRLAGGATLPDADRRQLIEYSNRAHQKCQERERQLAEARLLTAALRAEVRALEAIAPASRATKSVAG